VLPDIQLIYDKINDNLYNSELPSMTVMWTEQDVIVGDQNFKISMSDHRIILNESTLLLRPRIDLFSVLLHITIHLYLHQQSFGEHNFHEHDSNFQKIMKHFNQIFRCQISCSHKFSCTGSEYKKQWYHCSGICQNYPPFRGIYRSATGPPSSQNSYWADHENYCGGSFFKLFEIYRNGLDGTERKYVKNAKYMNPKSLAAPTRIKTEFSPRELVDLTLDDDDQRGAQVIQLTDIIDLDLNDTPDLEAEETVDIANRFISNFNLKHSSVSNGITFCPICQNRVFQENFVLHLDGCKGNIQQVVFDPSKISYTRLRTEFQ
jgi:predicted SprT family Zn-dependent metalloprotease